MSTVISVENISKQYRLGQVGTGTLSDDLTRLWCRLRGKEDPFLKIGQTNDRTKKADTTNPNQKSGLLSRLSPLAPRNSPDLVWALKDISFEVKEGEVLGIIGRNGAGKSTLLKILARVTTPTTGEIKVNGRIASLLEVGTGFHPDLSGRENIYLNGAILGMRKHEITKKLDEIIDFSGCDRYIDTPVKRYSSGMYVRLAFAVAAHLDPEILIVDEVLAVGDVEFQKKCIGKMQGIAKGGRTVLFVSHNLTSIGALCLNGLMLDQGNVALAAPIQQVIDRYLQHSSTTNIYEWTGSSGDDNATMTRTWVRSQHHGGQFLTDTEIEVGICVEIHREFAGLVLGFRLYSEFGHPLAYVLIDDMESSRPPTTRTGQFECRFTIPRDTLAAGRYRIGFEVAEAWVKAAVLDTPGELWFEIENVSGLARRYPIKDHIGFTSIFRPNWHRVGPCQQNICRTSK